MIRGVPLGSNLGSLLFNLHVLPHGINFHGYADDTRLDIAVFPIKALFKSILDIKSWMTGQFLQLNQDKMRLLVIGPKAPREKLNFLI